jgi:2-amino-4-hydroxy-6-hydroxymethyldihydropteridine diphosphokinase
VTAVSSLYETTPVGVIDQPDFLNAVVQVRTTRTPEELLQTALDMERKWGRVRTQRWGPRVLDIDLLVYGDRQIDTPALTVPHPRLRERAFVVVPLAEIAPDLVLPGDGEIVEKIAEKLRRIGNNLGVRVVTESKAGLPLAERTDDKP